MRNLVKSLLIGFCLALASCSGGESVADAEKEVAIFHQRLDAGNIEEIWKFTSSDLNKSTTIKEFGDFLTRVHSQLGNVVSTKQTNWKRSYNDSGNFVTVAMETKFERGTGQEEFVFRVFDDKMLLGGYHINWKVDGVAPGAAKGK